MALNLSTYTAIQTHVFVRIDIPGYQVLRFSDFMTPFTINSESYTGLGSLMAVTDTTSELRATNQEVSISISGIPDANISDVLNNRVKGSNVKIYRAFFNPSTGVLLDIADNPAQKFQGVISNFDISDELSMGETTGTVLLTLTATSIVALLTNKQAGRRTNPVDMKLFYPTDVSFDRVLALENSNFNFGAA
jgi:hypothetical protein